jgi:hypothetical protein
VTHRRKVTCASILAATIGLGVLSACGSGLGSDSRGESRIDTASPELDTLVRNALKCKFDQGDFDQSCPTFLKWLDTYPEARREDDAAVFAMSLDPDERVRVLAGHRPLPPESRVFSDKSKALATIAQAGKETNRLLCLLLGERLGLFDIEALGLEEPVRGLAKNAAALTRKGIATGLLSSPSPWKIDVVGGMLADEDSGARAAAAMSLALAVLPMKADSPMSVRACELFQDAVSGPHVDDMIVAGARLRRCTGLQEHALQIIDAKTQSISAVTEQSLAYTFAVDEICRNNADQSVKKQGFEIAKRLAQSDRELTKVMIIRAFVSCDPAGAKAEILKLTSDASPAVVSAAKSKLAEIEKGGD